MNTNSIKFNIKEESFLNGKSLIDIYSEAKEEPMKKLNVKIRRSDLRIIESIANLSGTPRSQIVNNLIIESIDEIIKDIANDDFDCAALIASHADTISGVNRQNRGSWSDKVFTSANDRLNYYYEVTLPETPADAFSEQFKTLKNRLEKVK